MSIIIVFLQTFHCVLFLSHDSINLDLHASDLSERLNCGLATLLMVNKTLLIDTSPEISTMFIPGGVLNFELGTDVRPEVLTTTL